MIPLMTHITLGELSVDSLTDMICKAIFCSEQVARPLGELVYQKTDGNPFFAIQVNSRYLCIFRFLRSISRLHLTFV